MSYRDASGSRVFRYQGGLYRGVPEPVAGHYRRLFADGTVDRLVDDGMMVDTAVADVPTAAWPLVLRHREIPVVSYPAEWCFEMLRDAGRLAGDLAETLIELGLTFTDPSGWNVLFEGPDPVYIDFASIQIERWYQWERELEHEFRVSYIEPLTLMSRGHLELALQVLRDHDKAISDDVAEMLGFPSKDLFPPRRRVNHSRARRSTRALYAQARRVRRRVEAKRGPLFLPRRLRRELDAVPVPARRASDLALPSVTAHAATAELLRRGAQRVVELGAARGGCALLLARHGVPVIAIDRNEAGVAALYRAARAQALGVLPLVVDVRSPTPGAGLLNAAVEPALSRLTSDSVVALGILDALTGPQHVPLERAVATISRFGTRMAVIDVPTETDANITPDDLRAALACHYADVEQVTPAQDGAAALLIGRR